MKLIKGCFVVLMAAGSCRESRLNKMIHLYKAEQKAFTQQRVVNNFSLQLSYLPASMLMHQERNKEAVVQDTSYYYFKLQVVCPATNTISAPDKTALYYGLDSLFATAEAAPLANPALVEPVITGNPRLYEYLLVFDKKNFSTNTPVKIVFFDRLFTNTKQVFEFDRIKIDEIETLQYHAHEA